MQPHTVLLNDALFVLYSAELLKWPDITRTNFQKILYLCASLSPLVNIEWGYPFSNAPYGPFNKDLHEVTGRLVIPFGYAQFTDVVVQRDSKIRERYKITSEGVAQVELISGLKKEKGRLDWIHDIMKVLDIYGQTIITKLAYQEPTFNQMRKQNGSGVIELAGDENLSIPLLDALCDEMREEYSIHLDTPDSKLVAFFDFLSSDIGQKVK